MDQKEQAGELVEVCDGCKKPPQLFFTPAGREVWWVVLDKDGEAAHLLSNLEFKFLCAEDKTPIRVPERHYWCVECVERMQDADE